MKHTRYLLLFCIILFTHTQFMCGKDNETDLVTIAILAKDKAHTLPLYLHCIENQTWPKEKTLLYIRTNNNNDATTHILADWIEKVGHLYHDVYFDYSDVSEPVHEYGQHEWNCVRFKVLGKIRQDSLDWAHEHHSHYFVIDCDNFILPHTLETLVKTNLPIVAPFLKLSDAHYYSNFHSAVDKNGYLETDDMYYKIWGRAVQGLIQVPVVHCTYLIRYDVQDKLTYDDESYRFEYVIFSDSARKNNIAQYLDNRELYGRMTFAETREQLEAEEWLQSFIPHN